MGTTEVDPDTSGRDTDRGADLQQETAYGAALCRGTIGVLQADRAQGVHDHVGNGRKPLPKLIRPHPRRRYPIGEQAVLLLLDAILHIATGAVPLTIQFFGVGDPEHVVEVGDNKARIRLGFVIAAVLARG